MACAGQLFPVPVRPEQAWKWRLKWVDILDIILNNSSIWAIINVYPIRVIISFYCSIWLTHYSPYATILFYWATPSFSMVNQKIASKTCDVLIFTLLYNWFNFYIQTFKLTITFSKQTLFKRLTSFVFHPVFLALVVTTAIILLFIPRAPKYVIEKVDQMYNADIPLIFYDDMDGNGYSDRILVSNYLVLVFKLKLLINTGVWQNISRKYALSSNQR